MSESKRHIKRRLKLRVRNKHGKSISQIDLLDKFARSQKGKARGFKFLDFVKKIQSKSPGKNSLDNALPGTRSK